MDDTINLLSSFLNLGNGADYISDLFEPGMLRYNLRNSDHNLTQPLLSQFIHLQGFAFVESTSALH